MTLFEVAVRWNGYKINHFEEQEREVVRMILKLRGGHTIEKCEGIGTRLHITNYKVLKDMDKVIAFLSTVK